ncbi:hypothetical protein YPPY09_4430, partial [Yersinia pestis PY-09]
MGGQVIEANRLGG